MKAETLISHSKILDLHQPVFYCPQRVICFWIRALWALFQHLRASSCIVSLPLTNLKVVLVLSEAIFTIFLSVIWISPNFDSFQSFPSKAANLHSLSHLFSFELYHYPIAIAFSNPNFCHFQDNHVSVFDRFPLINPIEDPIFTSSNSSVISL